MSKVTFYGLPAWVGAIHGPTACEWWDHDPAQLSWDRSRLHPLDLAKTVSAALAGQISVAQVEVDDHATKGGRTTIGPRWPGGATIGAVWVSESYLQANQLTAPSHEFQLIQYFDGEQQNRRFYGFQASVLQTQNQLSLVQLWHPGTGATAAPPAGTWWLDLSASADPSTPPPGAGQPAPLYLDAKAASQLVTVDPKIPTYVGTLPFPSAPPGA
ncbi:MAG TPA: hypothetical protein VHW23_31335 [Kofleriaceae bacterium]|jgi:hypothetical protein|nr:hypothetical protein [Kofleriaceae bacterium]